MSLHRDVWRSSLLGVLSVLLLVPTVAAVPFQVEEDPPAVTDELAGLDGGVAIARSDESPPPLEQVPTETAGIASPRGAQAPAIDIGELVPNGFGESPERPDPVAEAVSFDEEAVPLSMRDSGRDVEAGQSPFAVRVPAAGGGSGRSIEFAPAPAALARELSPGGIVSELRFEGFRRSIVPGLSARSADDLGLDEGSGWEIEIDQASLSESLPQNVVDRMVVWIWAGCDSKGNCRIAEPLPTQFDDKAGTYRAELPAGFVSDAGGLVLTPLSSGAGWSVPTAPQFFLQGTADQYTGLAPGVSGAGGTYGANDVSSLASWQVGPHTGYATTSIPIQVPPAVGPVPSIGYSYSSGSVDGMSVATNNQPSQVGVGWDQNQPVIRRATRGCSTGSVDYSGQYEGNLCLASSNLTDGFTLTMNGVGGRLVATGDTGNHPRYSGATWVGYELETKNDFRIWKVQLDAAKGDGPGDTGGSLGEWWEVTTGDGTLFVFGRNWMLKPSGPLTATPLRQNRTSHTSVQLESVQVVPVMVPGGVSGAATGACNGFVCAIETSWFLDQTIDTSGNMAMYGYRQETNRYRSRNNGTLVDLTYDRAVSPEWIDYGIRFGDTPTAGPTNGVTFGPRFRVNYGYLYRNPEGTYPNGTWHDTPTDLVCGPGETCDHESPSFFTQMRLKSIQTYAGSQSSYSYVFDTSWPSTGDTSEQKLWLDAVHKFGPGTIDPPIEFDPVFLPNRVNPSSSPMSMPRIETITTELGGEVTFDYGQPFPPVSTGSTSAPCYSGANDANGYVRMPCNMFVAYQSEYDDANGNTNAGGFVLFNSYVVETETRDANYGAGTQDQVLTYTYDTPPDWAYSGTWGFTETDSGQCRAGWGCNLWNDYRGHRQVTVTDGDGTRTTYQTFTGMADDRYSVSNTGRLADVQPSNSANNITDFGGGVRENLDRLAGFRLSHRVADNQDHMRSLNTTLYRLDLSEAAYPQSYRMVWTDSYTRAGDAVSNNVDHNHRVATYFDTVTRPSRIVDYGSIINATTADDTTTFRQYYSNTNDWIVSLPRLISTKPGVHTTNPWGGWVAATSYTYDNQSYQSAPIQGRVTREQVQRRMVGGPSNNYNDDPVWITTDFTYTARGQLSVVNPATAGVGSTSHSYDATWGYRTSTDGPLSGTADTTTFNVDQRHGGQTSIDGPDTAATTLGYDGLGRLTSVRAPGAPQDSYRFTYNLAARPAWVATEVLRQAGSYVPSYDIVDGFGRTIQTQVPTSSGTDTVISSMNYGNNGAVRSTFNPVTSPGAPNGALRSFSLTGIPRTTNTYTSEGRVTATTYNSNSSVYAAQWTHTRGNQTITSDANLEQTITTFDVWGNPTRITDDNGDYSTFDYNVRRQLIQSTDQGFVGGGNRAVIQTMFDDWEINPRRLIDPDLGTITYTYDSMGRLATQDDQANPMLSMAYNAASQPTTISAGSTVVSSWVYSNTGRLTSSTHNNVVAGSPQGTVTKAYGYDTRGRLDETTWTIPGLAPQTIEMSYRESGQIDTVTYPNNQITDYGFDSLDRQVSLTHNGTLLGQGVGYNPAGQVTSLFAGVPAWPVTDQAVITRLWHFEQTSQRIDQMQTVGLAQSDALQSQVVRLYRSALDRDPDANGYRYWMANRGLGYPHANLATDFVNSAEFATKWANYTDPFDGTPHDLNTNAGFVQWAYGHIQNRAPNDRADAGTWVTQLNNNTITKGELVATFSDTSQAIANPDIGSTDATNPAPTGHNKAIGDVFHDLNYDWDNSGDLNSIHDTSSGISQWQCFDHDNLHRLTNAYTVNSFSASACTSGYDNAGPDPYSVAYTYHPNGNIRTANGTGTLNATYTYGSTRPHAVTSAGANSYTYNNRGNATQRVSDLGTQTLVYDIMNRLVEINGAGADMTALYDADGVRVKRVLDDTTNYYVGDTYEVIHAPPTTQPTTTTTQPTTSTTQPTTSTTQATTSTTSGTSTTTTGGTKPVVVRARSYWQVANFDLEANGTIVGSAAVDTSGWQDVTFNVPTSTGIGDLRILFGDTPDATLGVFHVIIDGVTHLANGPDVLILGRKINGTCQPADYYEFRNIQCAGWFDFSALGGGTTTTTQATTTTTQPTTTTTQATTTTTQATTTTTTGGTKSVTVRARSFWQVANFDLEANGVVEGSAAVDTSGWQDVTFNVPASTGIGDLRILFSDVPDATLGVFHVIIDGVTHLANGPDVLILGRKINGTCQPADYYEFRNIQCTGWFDFSALAPPSGPTVGLSPAVAAPAVAQTGGLYFRLSAEPIAPTAALSRLFAAPPGLEETIQIHHNLAGHRIGTTSNGVFTAAVTDNLGSGGANRSDDGSTVLQRYTPFGVNRAGDNELLTDFTFTGQTDDPGTALIDYNARHYDPQLGRFIMADTVLDGPNRFTYVRNNPLRHTDPTGNCVNWDGSIMPYAECTVGSHGEGTRTVDTAGVWAGGGVITPMNDDYEAGDDLRVLLRLVANIGSFIPFADTVADPYLCGDSVLAGSGAKADCAGAALPVVGAGWLKLGDNIGEALFRALRHSEVLDELPEMVVESRQFGQKWRRHASDFGLDVTSESDRLAFADRISSIRANPVDIRQGAWNPRGGGASDHLFFSDGTDVVVTQADGTFVTILSGTGNGWFNNARSLS